MGPKPILTREYEMGIERWDFMENLEDDDEELEHLGCVYMDPIQA